MRKLIAVVLVTALTMYMSIHARSEQDSLHPHIRSLPLDLSRRIYEATRAGIIHLAGQHYSRSAHFEFIHSETGIRTLRDEFDKIAAHNEHHLDQIEVALKQKE